MKIIAVVIGTGKQKHVGQQINLWKIICEKIKKIKLLKKNSQANILLMMKIFKNKSINLVSIASYDNYHFKQMY